MTEIQVAILTYIQGPEDNNILEFQVKITTLISLINIFISLSSLRTQFNDLKILPLPMPTFHIYFVIWQSS